MEVRNFFTPFSFLYGVAVHMRNRCYDAGIFPSYRSPLPVICVGNATSGGAGKSPFCIYLANKLISEGRVPVILSRGYGGRQRSSSEVLPDSSPRSFGDEPVMQRQAIMSPGRVFVSPNRLQGCCFIEEFGLGDVVILDDGLQHRRLQRDCNILLIRRSRRGQSVVEELAHERFLPAGRLRESIVDALKRTDIIVSVWRGNQSGAEEPEVKYAGRTIPHITTEYQFVHTRELMSGERYSPDYFRKKDFVALAGIAQPEQFFTMLNEIGCRPRSTFTFPDHYDYKKSDWQRFVANGPIVTTAKDAVKLAPFVRETGQVYVMDIAPTFPIGEEDRLWEYLERSVGGKSRHQPVQQKR